MNDVLVDFKVVQIDGGDMVLLGEKGQKIAFSQNAQLYERSAQSAAISLLLFFSSLKLLDRDHVLTNEQFTQPGHDLSGF